jgi:hypothetical protein
MLVFHALKALLIPWLKTFMGHKVHKDEHCKLANVDNKKALSRARLS